ncbi:MAG: hypothetical protein D6753_03560 [Planctomycetota bacterium]|nr:MAG: hypothetical protein D6753_03560 [Planctomycetota bacterium]
MMSPCLLGPWLIAQAAPRSNSAIVAFVVYLAAVIFLAWLSTRVPRRSGFLSEYFLGGRNLGVWAFALTFAATSASGGSFIGFPSIVYSHGWSVALWIGSYMLMPLVAMGLLAKRLNQVARQTDAITIPDLIRDRFQSPALGLVATLFIIFFMTCNLIAQFKGGSLILQTLLQDVPAFQYAVVAVARMASTAPGLFSTVDPAYLLCLIVFAASVVGYTTYGGFRAVVWTDVMQGIVMVMGIMVLLPLTLIAVGGLGQATRDLASVAPPTDVQVELTVTAPLDNAPDLLFKNSLLAVRRHDNDAICVLRLAESARRNGHRLLPNEPDRTVVRAIEIHRPLEDFRYQRVIGADDGTSFQAEFRAVQEVAFGNFPGAYTSLPGPDRTNAAGFLPAAAAISFFFFWCFSSAGQPSNMIRCMAFRDSSILSRAILTVACYYSLIYFPIVVIFCCAQTLLPGWETASDRVMPEMTATVTAMFQVPWLAGLLVAAPFAAVMSTMDSFLLMISSAVVRDIYQRWIQPHPSQRRIKVLTYATTMVVGLTAMLAAINPPHFLQNIIVFTGAGLSTTFLVPVALALYWPRFNTAGAAAGMLAGFLGLSSMYLIGWAGTGTMAAYQPWGLHPFLIGGAASLIAAIGFTLITPPPRPAVVRQFFYRPRSTAAQ